MTEIILPWIEGVLLTFLLCLVWLVGLWVVLCVSDSTKRRK